MMLGGAIYVVACVYQFGIDLHVRFFKYKFLKWPLYIYTYNIDPDRYSIFCFGFFLLTIIRHQMMLGGCNKHSFMCLPILGRFEPTVF